VLFIGSMAAAFAQSAIKPGQIAAESADVSSPGFLPVGSPSVTVVNNLPTAEDRHARMINRIWIASLFAMAAASGIDAGTSWGKQEGNSLLASSDGRFGAKGVSIKAGVAAGVILPQVRLHRHKYLKSKFAIGNFAGAALFGTVAIHNMGIAANN
jgi:hypothetical protein